VEAIGYPPDSQEIREKSCVPTNCPYNEGPSPHFFGVFVAANSENITLLLQQWGTGDQEAEARLFELLMPDLRRIAALCLRRERPGHTLQRTELVNEAFLKLAKAKNIDWRDRGHFFAIVTVKMRRFLIDYARKKPRVELLSLVGLPEHVIAGRTRLEAAVAVDRLLDELEKESPRTCSVVVLMSYLGLSSKEAADNLGIGIRTVEREWHDGRKWLFQRLTEKPCKTKPSATSA
jgi:RNA polymerase sigma factor (TIGR02999 family)